MYSDDGIARLARPASRRGYNNLSVGQTKSNWLLALALRVLTLVETRLVHLGLIAHVMRETAASTRAFVDSVLNERASQFKFNACSLAAAVVA